MLKRALLALLIGLATWVPSRAISLEVQLYPLTGEIRFRNPDPTPVDFVFYSIKSNTNGALNTSNAQWKSIADNYDASGNHFIDATHEWVEIEAISKELTEGLFTPNAVGSLPAFNSLNLGQAWNPGVVPYTNLTFDIRQANEQSIPITVKRSLEGDYNGDLTVNNADYSIWRQSFGSTSLLDADGNGNGIVDAPDYVAWRRNFGNSLPPLAPELGAGQPTLHVGGAVPEPTSALLLATGLAAITALAPARRAARRR